MNNLREAAQQAHAVLTSKAMGKTVKASFALQSLIEKIAAALALPDEHSSSVWLPMASAPKDGTMLRLLVEFEDHATADQEGPSVTIGVNTFDNHGDEDEWLFAGWDWCHDCYTQGTGKPVGWLPMLGTQPAIGLPKV